MTQDTNVEDVAESETNEAAQDSIGILEEIEAEFEEFAADSEGVEDDPELPEDGILAEIEAELEEFCGGSR